MANRLAKHWFPFVPRLFLHSAKCQHIFKHVELLNHDNPGFTMVNHLGCFNLVERAETFRFTGNVQIQLEESISWGMLR